MKAFQRLYKQGGRDSFCDSIAFIVAIKLHISTDVASLDPIKTPLELLPCF